MKPHSKRRECPEWDSELGCCCPERKPPSMEVEFLLDAESEIDELDLFYLHLTSTFCSSKFREQIISILHGHNCQVTTAKVNDEVLPGIAQPGAHSGDATPEALQATVQR